MLTIWQGGFATSMHETLCERLAQSVAQNTACFLLVPEQQALIAERETAKVLPASAPLVFEVTNFSRLANTVFRTYGGVAARYSDGTVRALLMWQALSEAAPLLSSPRTEVNAASVESALAAMKEIQSFGLTPTALSDAAESDGAAHSVALQNKLRDLSIVLTTYQKIHNARYNDVTEDIGAVRELLAAHPECFRDAHFFVEGFTSFTEPQLALLSLLIERANVTVLLTLDVGGEETFPFTETRRTKEKLLLLASRASVEKKIKKFTDNASIHSELLYEILRGMWQYNTKIDNNCLQNSEKYLKIWEAETPQEEAEFLASDIIRRVSSGESFSDFAIVARNADDYVGILDTALSRASIPTFFSKRQDIVCFEPVKLIRLGYRILLDGFRRADVIAYAKCGLCGVSREDCDTFELYTETWQIDGKRFYEDGTWNMNPNGYTDRVRSGTDTVLATIDRTRRAILAPLLILKTKTAAAHTVKEHAVALFEFLRTLSVEQALAQRAAELRRDGESDAARENERLFRIICDTLDKICEATGDLATDTRGFDSLLSIALNAVDIGRIPNFCDVVTVGSANTLRLEGKKHVYLFGVNGGEFPANAGNDSCFSDRERQTLAKLGLPIEPTEDVRAAKELFFLSRAFATASETVTILTATHTAAFAPTSPSPLVERIVDMTDGVLHPVPISSLSLAERVYTADEGIRMLGDPAQAEHRATLEAALAASGNEAHIEISHRSIFNDDLSLSERATAALYHGDLSLTQTRIEQYIRCPLSHFCQYVLALDQNRRAAFDALNIGTFVHAILETFFAESAERDEDLAALTDEKRRTRVERHARAYIDRIGQGEAMATARREQMIRRLTLAADAIVSGLCDELGECRYKPAFFELPIRAGNADLPSPVRFRLDDRTEACIYGTIDRVDVFADGADRYLRVVDYKTGSKSFSPSDLEAGQNLQMFLYLQAITESESFAKRLGVGAGGRVIPAGVIYVETKLDPSPIQSPEKDALAHLRSEQARSGMLLDDPVSLAAMNPKYIPIRFKKDGTPDARSAEKLYTEEGWEQICQTVRESVVRVANRMRSGRIPAGPLRDRKHKNVCEYCSFKPICRNVDAFTQRSSKSND